MAAFVGIEDRLTNRHHGDAPKPAAPRDWRRIHHSPLFWIGVAMCLAAIMVYVLTDDLSWRPAAR